MEHDKYETHVTILPAELIKIAKELVGKNLHGRKMEDLSDVIETTLAGGLLTKALDSRGKFYDKNFNALRRLRFKNNSMQDVPMPKKRRGR